MWGWPGALRAPEKLTVLSASPCARKAGSWAQGTAVPCPVNQEGHPGHPRGTCVAPAGAPGGQWPWGRDADFQEGGQVHFRVSHRPMRYRPPVSQTEALGSRGPTGAPVTACGWGVGGSVGSAGALRAHSPLRPATNSQAAHTDTSPGPSEDVPLPQRRRPAPAPLLPARAVSFCPPGRCASAPQGSELLPPRAVSFCPGRHRPPARPRRPPTPQVARPRPRLCEAAMCVWLVLRSHKVRVGPWPQPPELDVPTSPDRHGLELGAEGAGRGPGARGVPKPWLAPAVGCAGAPGLRRDRPAPG